MKRTFGSPNLLSLALSAPLIAVRQRNTKVFHAVTMEAVVKGWKAHDDHPRRCYWFTTACGIEKARLLGQDGVPTLWPPYNPKAPFIRCRECHEATGRKRPRTKWVPAGAAS